ncbi:hypothetical protein [Alicyclobacillus pomorum]|uniref:hypothetical protein n=1 Tax=Alicyclobacillus pomorum TaxID=204470 RepID=UPI0003FBB3D8|nr:hypothetical protein [Alicyclobacillus pomorum]
MTFQFRGVPIREINGLPYAVHQIGDHQWQIVIGNCARHPAGYTYTQVYDSYEEALRALERWPSGRVRDDDSAAGDDTSAVYEAQSDG